MVGRLLRRGPGEGLAGRGGLETRWPGRSPLQAVRDIPAQDRRTRLSLSLKSQEDRRRCRYHPLHVALWERALTDMHTSRAGAISQDANLEFCALRRQAALAPGPGGASPRPWRFVPNSTVLTTVSSRRFIPKAPWKAPRTLPRWEGRSVYFLRSED